VKRIDELLKSEPAIADGRAPRFGFWALPALRSGTRVVLKGEIEFRHLNFSYGDGPDATPVLRDISLHIPAGSSFGRS